MWTEHIHHSQALRMCIQPPLEFLKRPTALILRYHQNEENHATISLWNLDFTTHFAPLS